MERPGTRRRRLAGRNSYPWAVRATLQFVPTRTRFLRIQAARESATPHLFSIGRVVPNVL